MYTYNEHLQRCAEYARQGISDKETYVQLRILKGQTTACARILGLWVTPEGSHLWRLALQWPFSGLNYAPFERVRLCSGVGSGCTCQTQHGADTGRGGAPACGAAPRLVEAPREAFERLHFELLKKQAAGRDVMVTRHFSPENRKNCLKNVQP